VIETALGTMQGGEIFAVRLRGLPTCSFDSSLPVLPLPVLRPAVKSSRASNSPRTGATLPGGVKLAGFSHHLIDLGDMLLLEGDLFPGVFFKPHALVYYERE
jgi:hypothetical protein